MNSIELAASVAGGAMATARLLHKSRPFWALGPPWVQALLPALPLALAQIAGSFALVKTQFDLSEAVLIALLTVGTAVRGTQTGGK